MAERESMFQDEFGANLNNHTGNVIEPGSIDDEEEPAATDIQAFMADDDVLDVVDVEIILTEEEEELLQQRDRRRIIALAVGCLVVVIVVVLAVVLTRDDDDKGVTTKPPTFAPTLQPSASPSTAPTRNEVISVVDCVSFLTSKETFGDRGSGQWRALDWIINHDPYVKTEGLECPDKRYMTRYALATMFYGMAGENWELCGLDDPACLINRRQFGWLSNHDVCDWHQIRCNGTDVIGLNFGSQLPSERLATRFAGHFPSEIRYLTDLIQINLKEGGTQGPIQSFFKELTNLQEFNLENNDMTGALPDFFSGANFPNMRTILWTNNDFSGKIPSIHGTLKSLREYRIASNRLSGEIPPELADMDIIAYIDLANNQLEGNVTSRIFDKTELRILSLHNNDIVGVIPDDLSHLVFLERLKLQNTLFSGKIPSSLFNNLNLKEINLRSTRISGQIDPSIRNATRMLVFDIGINAGITGEIPDVFAEIEFLEVLKLDFTNLNGTLSQAVCDQQGTDFGQIEVLVVDCNIKRPSPTCGTCEEDPLDTQNTQRI